MKKNAEHRLRDTVYVIGAGFSAGLGYPLTRNLLIDVWEKLDGPLRTQLRKIIEFHHPGFSVARSTSFPGIEQLLTEVAVNLELFEASRPAEGKLTKRALLTAREGLLYAIALWFHSLYRKAIATAWLKKFVKRLQSEDAGIISFNWDLVLDRQLFGDDLGPAAYGLSPVLEPGLILLKPHGSLNWYWRSNVQAVTQDKRVEIYPADSEDAVDAFRYPRQINSKVGRKYPPLIVPPAYLKDFNKPIFRRLWNRCTDLLSTARSIVSVGYSLPPEDLQAQFILRCGFHNQLEGRLREDGRGRYPATRAAEVEIVNPDQDAARRIESVAGPDVHCTWTPKRAQDWV